MPKRKSKKHSKHHGHHNNTAINKTHIHIHMDKKATRNKSRKPNNKKKIHDLPLRTYSIATPGNSYAPPAITNKPDYNMNPFGQVLISQPAAPLVSQINRPPVFQSPPIHENAFTSQTSVNSIISDLTPKPTYDLPDDISELTTSEYLPAPPKTYFDLPEYIDEHSLMNDELADIHFNEKAKQNAMKRFKEQVPTNGKEEDSKSIDDFSTQMSYNSDDEFFNSATDYLKELEEDLKNLNDVNKTKYYEKLQNKINEDIKEKQAAQDEIFDNNDFVILMKKLKSSATPKITPEEKKELNSITKKYKRPVNNFNKRDSVIKFLEKVEKEERTKFKDALMKARKDEFENAKKIEEKLYTRLPPKTKGNIKTLPTENISGGGVSGIKPIPTFI